MSYQAISHNRSHRVPFHGLGRGPGYMSGCSGCGDGMGAGDWAAAGGQIATSAATIFSIASGAPKQNERASRNAMETARLNAGSAGATAAAQVEIARIQAETARLAAGAPQPGGSKTPLIIGAVVGGVALLGVLGFVLLKK